LAGRLIKSLVPQECRYLCQKKRIYPLRITPLYPFAPRSQNVRQLLRVEVPFAQPQPLFLQALEVAALVLYHPPKKSFQLPAR